MQLRHAHAGDTEAIAQLHAASWRSTYAAVLAADYLTQTVPSERRRVWGERLQSPKPNQLVVVAQGREGIVGFACVFADHHHAWGAYLDNLHVSAACQGQGVGRALLAEVARWCECRRPGGGLYLSVNQDNRRAQRFYRGLGAHHAEDGVWNAPDGSRVPTFRFTWASVASLCSAAAA